MTIQHTHPDLPQAERLARLKGIKKLCRQVLLPQEREERTD